MTIGDDEELFANAMNREPEEKPEPATTEKPEPDTQTERVRDEHGKFVSKAKEAVEEKPNAAVDTAKVEDKPVEQRVEQQDHRIPLADLLSEREKRQNAEREREDFRRQMETLTRQINESKQPKAEPPDPYADPQAFRDYGVKEAITPIERKMEDMRLGFSKTLAVEKFGAETVDAAFSAIEQAFQTNPQTSFEYQRIMASGHPYGELVAWHKRQSVLKEIGEDPAAYRARVLEEAKKDPSFVASIIEAARGQANAPAADGTRSTTVKLPPSLNRQTGSGGASIDVQPRTDGEQFAALFPQ